ncbi:MAG: hypothetical protein SCARUB_00473 [Candidatus Scalindua rubra]|uniref:YgjP-like metallopeptidase domain-containing protein n=1 Tax=Candidatus Scalindua rubra TaxID=1872076 RepID=A0A1E3XFC9_9BACT|nr:MAG: hypothetical protein SCARUB_00473 [Candidatus Scalindua rubra]
MELHDIQYNVSYRDIRYPRLEFTTGELVFVLPFGHKPEAIFNKHRRWILKKNDFIKECLKESSKKMAIKRTESEFKALIYSIIRRTSRELGVKLNKIYFRKMKTKWASCSSKRNLTVNTLMSYLPTYLIKYIIFHEAAHLIERKHNEKFWDIISQKYKRYTKMEKELFLYWFKSRRRRKNRNNCR